MSNSHDAVLWFSQINMSKVDEVGGKSASLGELMSIGANVPPGFSTTTSAFREFLEAAGADKINAMLDETDVSNMQELSEVSEQIISILKSTPVPKHIAKDIQKAYSKIGSGYEYVAARSSSNVEDGDEAEFAGINGTILNLLGGAEVVAGVHECWISSFTPQAISYRVTHGFDHGDVYMGVAVQLMVPADTAGIMFTHEPLGKPNILSVDAVWGLGERAVGGVETPDMYHIDKSNGEVVKVHQHHQDLMAIRNPDFPNDSSESNIDVAVPEQLNAKRKLSDDQLQKLFELGMNVQSHYDKPMDVEWAFHYGMLHVLQARPGKVQKYIGDIPLTEDEPAQLLMRGETGGLGVATGPVMILRGLKDLGKVKDGDIVVAEFTAPAFVPIFAKAAALVTTKGGPNCHAAITCRSEGLPCIVDAEPAMEMLQEGQIITVDASHGEIFDGVAETRVAWNELCKAQAAADKEAMAGVETKMKVMVIASDPDMAEKIASSNADGIGLVRLEEIISHAPLGNHPQWYTEEEARRKKYISTLYRKLRKFRIAMGEKRVVFRSLDFKQNEMKALRHGKRYEKVHEENPMMGNRGVFRYRKHPEVFEMEVDAYRRVYEEFGSLTLMLPFVRSLDELRWAIDFLAEHGLERGMPGFELWIMVELPTNVKNLEGYLELVDGGSIGSNDLTQLMLGVDRDLGGFGEGYDEMHPDVFDTLKDAFTRASAMGKYLGLCGMAATKHPAIVKMMVECGASSVSVTLDAVDNTLRTVMETEKEQGVLPQ